MLCLKIELLFSCTLLGPQNSALSDLLVQSSIINQIMVLKQPIVNHFASILITNSNFCAARVLHLVQECSVTKGGKALSPSGYRSWLSLLPRRLYKLLAACFLSSSVWQARQ
ncbi:Uncharacterised protein [Serratia proteamaculans]|nr:Uncharacterised protein [Serratia proteamaculans]CAI1557000.1 Uncharacterised protein [Serratia proteamaculans]